MSTLQESQNTQAPVKVKKTSYRAMTSLVTTWSFVIATVTGVVLYIVPEGRVANWTIWELWGLTKGGWTDLHVIFSIVFVVVGVAHLIYNWKPFKNYMAERASGHVHVSRTVYGSLAISAVFFGLTLYSLPPANWVMDLSSSIKSSWVVSPAYEPPFGHAEDVSLAGFAKRQRIDLDAAMLALKAEGVEIPTPEMAIKDLAALNAITPMALYETIKPLEPKVELKAVYTPAEVEDQFAGTGIGRKTLAEMAKEVNLTPEAAQARLAVRDIIAKPDTLMKEIAEAHDTEATELLKMLLIDGYRP
ncbi:MAG TPA: DUF4405 domain-containing protein [Magnetovibrio sp.]